MPGIILARRSLLNPIQQQSYHTNLNPSLASSTITSSPTTPQNNLKNQNNNQNEKNDKNNQNPINDSSQSSKSSHPSFSKVLYLNQSPLTDNHVPDSFLDAMLFNHNIQFQSFFKLFSLTAPILNKINTIGIWLALIYSIITSYAYNINKDLQIDQILGQIQIPTISPSAASAAALTTAIPSSSSSISSIITPLPSSIPTLTSITTLNPINTTIIYENFSNFINFSMVDQNRAEILFNSPLYKLLFSRVKPVFTCPHSTTTIPLLNIDLPPNPIGHMLCEFQDYALHRVTSTTLFYIFIFLSFLFSFLIFLTNLTRRKQLIVNNNNNNDIINMNHNAFCSYDESGRNNHENNKNNKNNKNDKNDQNIISNNQSSSPSSSSLLDPTHPRRIFKSLTRIAWITLSLLFLLTPLLTSISSTYSTPTTLSLWCFIAFLLLITVLYNDYSNLFDSVHLVYPPETILDMGNAKFIDEVMKKNTNPSGYIHIHTHMSHKDILDRFNNPDNVLKEEQDNDLLCNSERIVKNIKKNNFDDDEKIVKNMMKKNDDEKIVKNIKNNNENSTSITARSSLNSITLQHSTNLLNPVIKTTKCINDLGGPSSTSAVTDGNNFHLGSLPIPKTFSTIFSLNIVISVLAACGINQYLLLLHPSARSNDRQGFNHDFASSLNSNTMSDNFFIFVAFSVLFLSLPEIIYYYIAVIHHTWERPRNQASSTSLNDDDNVDDKNEKNLKNSSYLKGNDNIDDSSLNSITPTSPSLLSSSSLDLKKRKKVLLNLIITRRSTLTFPQKIYFFLSFLLCIFSVLLLTCHSVIQPFLLLSLLSLVGIISPIVLLIFRLIPYSKRVIRGPWDYDDYDEVGKDNI